eukprot:CAMPEP_0197865218 /NCGR_PEP_ID=MMETSP1438-20131217/43537_1 /TAXON_ID=1461541 /ORGANISM="Pterosperma sp., Strain CCMP1384" /LENGTH=507 /DNA_ID=CAMNT_0043483645 /DNA_START=469 /DNA_END=1992 /DNA_ORIENTATION=-
MTRASQSLSSTVYNSRLSSHTVCARNTTAPPSTSATGSRRRPGRVTLNTPASSREHLGGKTLSAFNSRRNKQTATGRVTSVNVTSFQRSPTAVVRKEDSEESGKIGVLLLNLGGPETLDDVQPFLYNLFADPDIIRLPDALKWAQKPLAFALSGARAPKSAEAYASIGGGSPLRRITDDQADALKSSLVGRGLKDVHVYVGMRYWYPFTEEALEAIKQDGVERLVVLPLYPQFSISTSGSSLRLIEEIFKTDSYLKSLKHTVIPSWYQRPGYLEAMADLIQNEVDKFRTPGEAHIFFSAHGVPVSYIEEGDPYKEEMEQCVDLIMSELKNRGVENPHTLAYQSRVGPVEWLKPYTDDSIKELGSKGVKSLLAVPISFVSEHIETLEEIDMEYRELAEESGIQNWGRVPALGVEPTFIDDLADAVIEALPYVGAMGPDTPELVPSGPVQDLLATYDRKRLGLPAPVTVWEWGFTKSAETWNGRVAMVAVVMLLLIELTTGHGVLSGFQ